MILRMCMQTFLVLTIQMWQSLRETSTSEVQGRVDLCIAIFILAYSIASIIFPFSFLNRNFERLPNPQFRAKYDSLYQKIDHYDRRALKNTSLFAGRRLLFAFIIVFCKGSIVLQVFLADILSTILLCFYLSVFPMDGVMNNGVQIFNEVVVLICIWLLFHQTYYV